MMITVSILPLMLMVFTNTNTLKNEIKASVHKEHALIAAEISQTIVEMVKTTQESLESIALTNPELFKVDNGANREDVIYRMLKKYKHLEEISMISSNGVELVKISKKQVISPKELKNISREKIFHTLKAGELYIGNPEIDWDNQIVFQLGVPIGGNEEYLSGAIVAKISLRQIMNKINTAKGKEGSYIFLVDNKGTLIGHSDYDQVRRRQDVMGSQGVKILVENKDAKNIENGKFETMVYQSYTNQMVLGVYGLTLIVNWGVIIEQPLDHAYLSIRQTISKIIVTLGILIILIGALSIFLVNLFMKSMNELAKGVEAVKSGNFNYKIPKQTNDEVGVVIEAFNNMIEEIKKKKENESLVMLAEKRAAIGLLAAGVAHEINNPMNNLGFYTADLLERLETEDINELYHSETIQNYLEIMKEQINRCSSITHNLLKISREPSIEIKPINLYRVIEDILKLMEHRLKKQKINVKIDVDTTDVFILSDESQMQQMLLNIITNAVDAMEEQGGTLTISIKKVEGEEVWLVKIIDTGYGIKEEVKGKIFDPFYTTKPIGKGTGLGLSISQVIVERMRGTIDIESKENMGTEIQIKFPISRKVE